MFKHILIFKKNYHLRMQMLSAACSLGPAAVFGAPVGGVFFSIEVTATFFYVHSLWKGILCAVSAKIAHSYFRGMSRTILAGKQYILILNSVFTWYYFLCNFCSGAKTYSFYWN